MALLKNLPLHESLSVRFPLETFNLFNHAEFFGPNTVDGNLQSFDLWPSRECIGSSVGSVSGEILVLTGLYRRGGRAAHAI
jgi:hypothetical protein